MTPLTLLALLAMMGAAIRFASRRAKDVISPTGQYRRISYAALVFALGFAIYLFLLLLPLVSPAQLVTESFQNLLFNGFTSLILISVADIAFKAMGAQRTRTWLIAGIVAFACPVIALAVLVASRTSLRFDAAVWVAFAVQLTMTTIAALVWWSFLQLEKPVEGVFE